MPIGYCGRNRRFVLRRLSFHIEQSFQRLHVALTHNHPSGDPSPSEADIKVTRDLIRAGQLLKIEVLDHVIIGNPRHASLRELGYFAM